MHHKLKQKLLPINNSNSIDFHKSFIKMYLRGSTSASGAKEMLNSRSNSEVIINNYSKILDNNLQILQL